ncbi:MAG: hypothetical protein ABIO45_08145 [Burkholderiaceae bacterium]
MTLRITPLPSRLSIALTALLLAPLALVNGASAADRKPAQSAPAKASAKAPVKKATPVETGPAAASEEQISASEQVFYGNHDCEFNQTAQVEKNSKYPGYVDVKQGKTTYVMKPVLSSTGALRLEDVRGQTLMVQIASKSMLLDVKAGRRIVDDCVSAKHREAVERYKQAKLDEAAAFAAAAASAGASGVVAVPGSGETRALLSGPGTVAATPAATPGLDAAARSALAAASAAPAPPVPAASAASAP